MQIIYIKYIYIYIYIIYMYIYICVYIYIYLMEDYQLVFNVFLMIYSKLSWISDIEHDPSGNSNLSFHVGTDILNLLFLYDFLRIFPIK